MSETNRQKRVAVIGSTVENLTQLGQKSIAATATKIVDANTTRHSIVIVNQSETKNVFIGYDATVTISNGLCLSPLSSMTLEGIDSAIYGIVDSGTAQISYWDLIDEI